MTPSLRTRDTGPSFPDTSKLTIRPLLLLLLLLLPHHPTTAHLTPPPQLSRTPPQYIRAHTLLGMVSKTSHNPTNTLYPFNNPQTYQTRLFLPLLHLSSSQTMLPLPWFFLMNVSHYVPSPFPWAIAHMALTLTPLVLSF